MSEIYVATDEQLQEAIYKGISKYFSSTKDVKELPDTINLDNAVKMLEEYGFSTSKAKIYKLSSAGEIPFRKYGNKLVFSRKELIAWAEEQTKRGSSNCKQNSHGK